eukprot:6180456-Pleurochrysis_carterae.AAC.1
MENGLEMIGHTACASGWDRLVSQPHPGGRHSASQTARTSCSARAPARAAFATRRPRHSRVFVRVLCACACVCVCACACA